MAEILPRVQMEFNGQGNGWTRVTQDVSALDRITVDRSLPGPGPLDRVQNTGVARFAMLNSTANHLGLQGLYSPKHANARSGFGIDTGVRISLEIDSDACVDSDCLSSSCASVSTVVHRHTGKIASLEVRPGQYEPDIVTFVESRDFVDDLSTQSMPACSVLEGVNESDAVQELFDNLVRAPRESLVKTSGPDTYAYVFDRATGDNEKPITEIQRICQSSYGTFYIRGDGTPVYEPRNEKRAVFGSSLTAEVDLDEDDLVVSRRPRLTFDRGRRVNKVRTVITPREVDGTEGGGEVVVAQVIDAIPFPPGVTTTLVVPFTDPDDRGIRAGGVSLVTPQENTDYDFNTQEDGGGSDESANVTVTATFCGTNVELAIDTSALSQTVYPVTSGGAVLLQARGIAIISKESLFFEAEDATSVAAIGEQLLTVNMPYQSSRDVAEALAGWFKDNLADDEQEADTGTVRYDDADTARAADYANLEISDIVTLDETVSGMDGTEKFFVQGVSDDFLLYGRELYTTFYLARADTGPFIQFSADHLATGGKSGGGITSVATPSITPTADYLVLISVAAKRGSSTNPGTPTVAGCNLTISLIDDVIYDGAGTDRRRLWLFGGMSSSPTSGALTIDNFNGTSQEQDRVAYSVCQIPTTGASVAAAAVQSATNSGTDVSTLAATLAAFANAANRPFKCSAVNADDEMTVESGYTTIGIKNKRTSMVTGWNKDATDTSPTVTIPGASGAAGIVAIEIKKD